MTRSQHDHIHEAEEFLIDSDGYAPVAQLDRATGFEPVGRGFDSLRAHLNI
jgi:hypothetical protein